MTTPAGDRPRQDRTHSHRRSVWSALRRVLKIVTFLPRLLINIIVLLIILLLP